MADERCSRCGGELRLVDSSKPEGGFKQVWACMECGTHRWPVLRYWECARCSEPGGPPLEIAASENQIFPERCPDCGDSYEDMIGRLSHDKLHEMRDNWPDRLTVPASLQLRFAELED